MIPRKLVGRALATIVSFSSRGGSDGYPAHDTELQAGLEYNQGAMECAAGSIAALFETRPEGDGR